MTFNIPLTFPLGTDLFTGHLIVAKEFWDEVNLLQASAYPPPPPETKEWETHSPAGEVLGESQFGRLERKLSTLSTLCLYCYQDCNL